MARPGRGRVGEQGSSDAPESVVDRGLACARSRRRLAGAQHPKARPRGPRPVHAGTPPPSATERAERQGGDQDEGGDHQRPLRRVRGAARPGVRVAAGDGPRGGWPAPPAKGPTHGSSRSGRTARGRAGDRPRRGCRSPSPGRRREARRCRTAARRPGLCSPNDPSTSSLTATKRSSIEQPSVAAGQRILARSPSRVRRAKPSVDNPPRGRGRPAGRAAGAGPSADADLTPPGRRAAAGDDPGPAAPALPPRRAPAPGRSPA